MGKIVVPMVVLKLFVQPLITFTSAFYLFGMQQDLWLIVAVVMAAQPIDAGVYVFAKQYNYQQDVISLSIIVSLLLALISIPLILSFFSA